jgi:hypothetical protein
MKIWYGYGSDHSANLVMIGEFKTEQDAAGALELIRQLTERAQVDLEEGKIEYWSKPDGFSEGTKERLREHDLYNYSPSDIADFAVIDPHIDHTGAKLTLRTDDVDIGAFVKLMVDKGAKVQVYSAHEHPDEDSSDSEGQDDD